MPNDIKKVINYLNQVRVTKNGYTACCPAHDDKNPSLTFWEDENDIKFKCFAGCSEQEIKDVLIKAAVYTPINADADKKTYHPCFESDLESLRLNHLGTDTHVHVYKDAFSKILGNVVRVPKSDGTKSIIVYTPHLVDGKVKLLAKGFPSPRPLYRLDALAENTNKVVLIVEGEKAVEVAEKMPELEGLTVITWQGGVAAVDKTDWTPLSRRRVVIWPDNDEPGKKAALRIKKNLENIGSSSVTIVDLPIDLPSKFDLADPIPKDLLVRDLIQVALKKSLFLSELILSANDLMDMDIPERENIIVPFLKVNSLNMIYAARGIGKTWVAMILAQSVSTGQNFLCYNVPKPRRVLFVDGEMPLADLKCRLGLIGNSRTNENLFFLASEVLYQNDQPLNINNSLDQHRIMQALDELKGKGQKVDLIIFDNLSSLSIGVDENDNTDLEAFLRWLLALRHSGYAILLVHHAGKNGDQRGASRREDLLDTVIQLKKNTDQIVNTYGANFIMTFTKTRGIEPDPLELNINLRDDENGNLKPMFMEHTRSTASLKTLAFIMKYKPKDQKTIADGLGNDKSTVSLHIKTLKSQGYISDKLEITLAGIQALKTSSMLDVTTHSSDPF